MFHNWEQYALFIFLESWVRAKRQRNKKCFFMRIVGLGVLDSFCVKHADCRKWVANWISDAKRSHWKTTHDIKNRYPSASFLENRIVIFNVRGNEYRLVVQVTFNIGVVAIKWAGTHSQYERHYG